MCGRTRSVVGLAKETVVLICLKDFVRLVNKEDMLCSEEILNSKSMDLEIRIVIVVECSVLFNILWKRSNIKSLIFISI